MLIPYVITLPKRSPVAAKSLGATFLSGAQRYYTDLSTIQGASHERNLADARESAANAGGQSSLHASKNRGGSGASNGGKFGKVSGGGTPPKSGGNPTGRNNAAAANAAINTRRARYGGSTKLKPGTERKLAASGAAVGAAPTIPLRNGENKPK